MKFVAAFIGIIILLLFGSLFATLMWYCFDDTLAELTGIPELGTIGWPHMWAFTLFISAMFKGSSSSSSN